MADVTDAPAPPGWTAPNSTKMPRDGKGGIDFSRLFTQNYADHYGIADPKDPSHNMTLCERLRTGAINEVRLAFTKSGSDSNVTLCCEKMQTNTQILPAI